MLSVKNLKVTYGNIAAISDVSFEVPEGKIVCLIGANGAGKTTTLRAVSGLVTPSGGSVTFKGMDITNTPAHKLVGMGISHVPEGRRIFPVLTVKENLELAAWTLKDKAEVKRRMDEVFEMFPRIRDRIGQLGGTLSGGEQQMLAVARAMIIGGDILLLDEPSMGLAPVLVDEIFDKIVAINKRGTTVLLVEQNAFEALEISDFAYVLEVGYSTISGPSKEIAADSRVREAYLGV
ncbi:MAG: ABC transporter ATP-binding protein [Geothrix sp.]|nr:ABC transporter ATP-binding protein [Geothrix sp.]